MINLLNSSTDIFSLEVDAIVNPVNCLGVMGAGLALEFKKRYPDNYKRYRKECMSGNLIIGSIFSYKLNNSSPNLQYILNLPTKYDWADLSQLHYIETGVIALKQYLAEHLDITSIAIPALGCGLGGLPWLSVKEILYNKLSDVENVNIYIISA